MKALTKLKDDARKHEQKEEWDKAVQLYLEVIRTAEETGGESELPLYNRVGDLYVRMGKPNEAVSYYEKAADRYADVGLYNNAIALCNKALRYLPNRTELLRKLGQFSASQGFITEARRWYLDYAERKLKEGALDEAFQSLDDFASVHEDADVREMLGRHLLAHNRREHALQELKKAHELRVAAGQTDAAVRLMDEILTIEPNAFSEAPTPGAEAAPAFEPEADSWSDPVTDSLLSSDAIGLEAALPEISTPAYTVEPGMIDLSALDLPGFATGESGVEEAPEIIDAPRADGVSDTVAAAPGIIDPGLIEIHLSVPEYPTAPQPGFEPTGLGMIDFGDTAFEQPEPLPEPVASEDAIEAPDTPIAAHAPDASVGTDPIAFDIGVPDHENEGSESLPFIDTDSLEDETFDLPLLEDPLSIEVVEPLPLLESDDEATGAADFEAPSPPELEANIGESMSDEVEKSAAPSADIAVFEVPAEPVFEPAPVDPEPEAAPEPVVFEIDAFGSRPEPQPPVVEEVPAEPALDHVDFETAAGFEIVAEPFEVAEADAGQPMLADATEATFDVPAAAPVTPAADVFEFAPPAGPVAFDLDVADEEPAVTESLPEADLEFGSEVEAGGAPAVDEEFADVSDADLIPHWTETLAAALDFARRGETAAAIEELIILHEALAADGMYAEALQVIDELVRLEPGSIGHLQQRVEYATRAADTPALIRAYLDLADRLARVGSTAKANAIYQRVLDIDPNNATARNAVFAPPSPVQTSDEGYVDLFSLLADDEEKDTRFVVAEKPPTGDEERDFADMLSQFKQKLAEHVPFEDSSSHYDLGLAFKEMGLIDEAITEFQTALKGGQDRLKIYEELGHCFLLKQQYNIAITILNRALGMGVDDGDLVGVYYYIGRSYEELGQRTEAKNAYERVVGVDISFKDAAERLSRL